ncbi:MAG: TIGR02444 family protein [Gammaproteobacteria bacterium]|jgi:uncharacterized protein (TIGR02444 family)
MNNYLNFGLHSKVSFPMFSEKAYAKQNVKRACFALRDKYRLNSNVILFCCWLANQNYPDLSVLDAQSIATKVSAWNDKIINGLRILRKTVMRQYLNDKFPLLFNLISDNERFAERVEQTLIAKSMHKLKRDYNSKDKVEKRALKNIFNYIKSQNIFLHKIDLEKVHCIVAQCFD